MKRWILIGAFFLVLFAGGAWGISRLLPRSSAIPLSGELAAATPQAVSTVDRLQQMLLDPAVGPEGRESLMGKIEIEKNKAAYEEAAKGNIAPKVAPEFPPQAQALAVAEIESGIFNGSEGMVRPEQAVINNYWQGVLDDELVMALAGAAADNSGQGLLVVILASPDQSMGVTGYKVYLAPGAGGSLRVTAEENGVLSLEGPTGAGLKFDLRSKTFLP